MKYNIKLQMQYLAKIKQLTQKFQFCGSVYSKVKRHTSTGSHIGAMKTKGKNIYKLLIYNKESISIKP